MTCLTNALSAILVATLLARLASLRPSQTTPPSAITVNLLKTQPPEIAQAEEAIQKNDFPSRGNAAEEGT